MLRKHELTELLGTPISNLDSPANKLNAFVNYLADNYSANENGALEKVSGPFNTMAIASRFTYLNNEETYSHMLVIGTDSFSETTAFRGQFGNTEILFNTIRLMTKENIAVTQTYKVLEDYSLSMETSSMYTFGIITVIAIPVVIFTLGIVVYIKRKHL